MLRIYITENELNLIRSVCKLIELNILNDDKKNISCYQIAKDIGISYNTVRKSINKIKEL